MILQVWNVIEHALIYIISCVINFIYLFIYIFDYDLTQKKTKDYLVAYNEYSMQHPLF